MNAIAHDIAAFKDTPRATYISCSCGAVLAALETYVNLRVYAPTEREPRTCIVPEVPTHEPG